MMRAAVEVLVVEPSERDARTTRSGIRQASEGTTVLRLKNADQALDYIHRKGQYQGSATLPPRMIFLEIERGAESGLWLLDRLQIDPETAAIPVVVLTRNTSCSWNDDSLARGARAYVVKPINKAEYMSKVAQLVAQWLSGSK